MRSSTSKADTITTSKLRGRPAKTEADHEEIRNRILDATAAAYAETGYHGLSVRSILHKAGLSRPTFYRHFSNADEPARLMITRAHQGLVERFVTQIPADARMEEKMLKAVDLYLDWAKAQGPLLRPFFVELHDPLSPVSTLRPRVLLTIADLYKKIVADNGGKLKNDLLVELMLTGIEFLGYRYYLEQSKGRISLAVIKDAMLRLMASTFDDPAAWYKNPAKRKQVKPSPKR